MNTRRTGTRRWTEADIPDLGGRTALVTGANTGIGFQTARALAEHGAEVVLACRDTRKGADAQARILAAAPDAPVSVRRLDLGSLASVRQAAAQLRAEHPRIDLLVNNAGLTMPLYGTTEDGFELQFGVNHLGHFALTGLLMDSLLAAPGSRIVTVSSNGHRAGDIYFDDLAFERGYRRMRAYGQAKLANLMFTYELQRRLREAGRDTIALAAHPGTAATELERNLNVVMRLVSRLVPHQDPADGALPSLRAATDPAARGGEYYGPRGLGQMAGPPALAKSSARSHDVACQRRLWRVSEELTGVTYRVGADSGQHAG